MPLYSYLCNNKKCGKEYDEALRVEDYQKPTNCPRCGKLGKKIIKASQKEPTFSDKIFPYYDRALNKVFQNRTERSSYLKRKGLSGDAGGTMTAKQERQLMGWRLGRFDSRIARNALRD